jgi:hypothetical protein
MAMAEVKKVRIKCRSGQTKVHRDHFEWKDSLDKGKKSHQDGAK